jgi:hypothetical protein
LLIAPLAIKTLLGSAAKIGVAIDKQIRTVNEAKILAAIAWKIFNFEFLIWNFSLTTSTRAP